MVDLGDPALLYDTGDVLRRDGACEQRGRFERDDGRFDAPGEVFGACAGAALYRRDVVMDAGGFDERFWTYLEDVDLALRLRLAGWGCRYEPVVARHAGEGSSVKLSKPLRYWVERNTLLLVAKAFPLRWLPWVAYRQARLGLARAAERRGSAPTCAAPRRRSRCCPRSCASAGPCAEPLRCRSSRWCPPGRSAASAPADIARVTLRRADMSALFVSYSGRFGGAERLLLDCAAALEGERVLACPPGELAAAATAGRPARGPAARARARAARLAAAGRARRAPAGRARAGGAPARARPAAGPAPGMGHALRDRPGRRARRHANGLPAQRPPPLAGASRGSCGPRRRATTA